MNELNAEKAFDEEIPAVTSTAKHATTLIVEANPSTCFDQ
jgi:hypothetical protein